MKTMKATKKMFALLLALVMAFAMNISVFAADLGTGQGSITITNATVGEDYTIYKIFDTDSTGAGSITATEAQKNFYEDQSGNPFTFTANTAGTYNVTVTTGESSTDVTNFLQGFVTEDSDGSIIVNSGFSAVVDASDSIEATSATVIFDNIPYGYYLVTSSLGAVVTVDSTNPNQEVIDKNQDGGSSFTKTVGTNDEVVEIGEPFEYTLSFAATNYDNVQKIKEYTITDIFENGLALSYEEDDPTYGVNVQIGNAAPKEDVIVKLVGNTLTITIPWVDGDEESLYSSPVNVTVTYKAVLTDAADIQTDIKNSAKLTWTGDSTGTSTEETVQTYALAIMKVDSKGNPLAGATFAVTKDGEAVNVSAVGEEGVYVVDPDGESSTVVSPESGLIVIKGVDNVAYTLTETAAPAGYNLLTDSITVTPTSESSNTITIYYDEYGNVTNTVTEATKEITSDYFVTAKVVVNEAGSLLPSTGGMGTTVIYIAGAALVIVAGVTLVVRRRMRAE